MRDIAEWSERIATALVDFADREYQLRVWPGGPAAGGCVDSPREMYFDLVYSAELPRFVESMKSINPILAEALGEFLSQLNDFYDWYVAQYGDEDFNEHSAFEDPKCVEIVSLAGQALKRFPDRPPGRGLPTG